MPYQESCIHFRGIQHETCKLDINMRALVGGADFGWAARMPCVKKDGCTVVCPSCHYPTPDEVAAHEAEMQAYMDRMRTDSALIGAAHTDEAQSSVFVCELCPRDARAVETTAAAISAHISEAHGLTDAEIRSAKGQMAQHLDAAEWSQNNDKFTLPDGRLLLIRSTRTRRRGSDKTLWKAETKSRGRR